MKKGTMLIITLVSTIISVIVIGAISSFDEVKEREWHDGILSGYKALYGYDKYRLHFKDGFNVILEDVDCEYLQEVVDKKVRVRWETVTYSSIFGRNTVKHFYDLRVI